MMINQTCHKYTQEARRSNLRLQQACSDCIYFDLTSTLGLLYDAPLTLIVTVPSDWVSCTVMQGQQSLACAIGSDGKVLLDVVPNRGRIALLKQ